MYISEVLISAAFVMFGSHEVNINWKDTARSVLPIYKELIYSGLRIWVFRCIPSSDFSLTISITGVKWLGLPICSLGLGLGLSWRWTGLASGESFHNYYIY